MSFGFALFFCSLNNLVQFCIPSGLGGNGRRDSFPLMEKKIYMKKLKVPPSPASLANKSLGGNSCSLIIKKDKEVAVWMLREKCVQNKKSMQTQTGRTSIPPQLLS